MPWSKYNLTEENGDQIDGTSSLTVLKCKDKNKVKAFKSIKLIMNLNNPKFVVICSDIKSGGLQS